MRDEIKEFLVNIFDAKAKQSFDAKSKVKFLQKVKSQYIEWFLTPFVYFW